MDTRNKKIPQKIVEIFIYYVRAIYTTMLMELNSLAAAHTNTTMGTEKQVTNFLNYCASLPDAGTESSSSSSWLVSVSQCSAHIKAVVFHSLHIVQKYTIIYTYLVSFATLYSLPLSQPGSITCLSSFVTFTFHPLPILLPPPPSPWPLSGLCLPASTTASPPEPLVSSLSPHRGPEAIA